MSRRQTSNLQSNRVMIGSWLAKRCESESASAVLANLRFKRPSPYHADPDGGRVKCL